jgi:hypothetical protein
VKQWCDQCEKQTTRYARAGGCRSCSARKGAAALNASLTPEQRSESARKAAMALNASLTPEQRSESARKASNTLDAHGHRACDKGAYRSGRVRLGRAIGRKREIVPALEAELAEMLAELGVALSP